MATANDNHPELTLYDFATFHHPSCKEAVAREMKRGRYAAYCTITERVVARFTNRVKAEKALTEAGYIFNKNISVWSR